MLGKDDIYIKILRLIEYKVKVNKGTCSYKALSISSSSFSSVKNVHKKPNRSNLANC